MARSEENVKHFLRQLARDFKAEAAIGAGDQSGFWRFHPNSASDLL